ncbi:ABC transporter substrate-binding protein [Vibrio hannami]|uniref:ABC transporter substrate-binding protein n=1 Tax=Vibrio hannami TaxID=2717094 RepID=UPI002410AD46|nr:ABC transporter substrate-binding protein [Vibrio hannami]MDG3086053.1 ABC transporter substrate-binding protein [Vibrio hannami]
MNIENQQTITFWNGNKSQVRQEHELKLLETILEATSDDTEYQLINDPTDYPNAEDEGDIFNKGADLLVTVAGNKKFEGKAFIPVNVPIANGILGNRILIIREQDQEVFSTITETELKTLRAGIPSTWADADLFRYNGYNVVEKGLFEEVFQRLKNNEFDYVSLGANEIESIYYDMARPLGGLMIESTLKLYYPFPLVFYVHPVNRALATRVEKGLEIIIANGEYTKLFNQFYGDDIVRLELNTRKTFKLDNPLLPKS